MQVWEAHRALSAAIGDTVVCTSTTVPPDGVRYTRAMRDSYLYRAMLKYIEKAIQVASSTRGDRSLATRILTPLFHEMIRQSSLTRINAGFVMDMNQYSASLTSLNPRPAYIFSVLGEVQLSGNNHTYIPIPFRDYATAAGLLNSRNVQRSDAFALLHSDGLGFNRLDIYSEGVALGSIPQVTITYLPYPVDPALQSTDITRLTERLGLFQTSMLGSVIGLATLYAKIDDQETGSLERFVPQLMELELASNSNVPDNTSQ